MNQKNAVVTLGRRAVLLGGAALYGLSVSRWLSGRTHSEAANASTIQISDSEGGTAGYDGTIIVDRGRLVNGSAYKIQLRGFNLGLWGGAVILNVNQPKDSEDLSGGTWVYDQPNGPNLNYLARWKPNVVRIGAPDASWLGYTCYSTTVNGDASTGWINPDPHGTYRAQFIQMVANLNAIGCYVILVVAFTNPGRSATLGQDIMANQDNDIQMWKSLAETFGYPNGTALKRNGGSVDDRSVIFELFNEPQPFGDSSKNWKLLMNGGFYNHSYTANPNSNLGGQSEDIFPYPCSTPVGTFIPGEAVTITGGITARVLCYYLNTTTGLESSGTKFLHLYRLSSTPILAGTTITGSVSRATTTVTSATYGWYVAGYAQMLASIRAAGAQNVCLLGGLDYDKDLGSWAAYAPSDSTPAAGFSGPAWTPQIGASWHPYPSVSWVKSAAVESGGSRYAVNDTILLPMPESGSAANSVYWQAKLKVTAVRDGAITAVLPVPYVGGTPGVAGGNNGQFNVNNFTGGVYCNLNLPSNPLAQYSTSGSGRGATFNLAFTRAEANSGTGDWPNYDTWAQVAALQTTRGVPVVITETGEHTGSGVSGSPWMSKLTSWCDANGISLVAYSYNPSPGWNDARGYDFALALPTLTNGFYHTPTPGYGEFMFNWFTTHPR